jgi:hypothetical protein
MTLDRHVFACASAWAVMATSFIRCKNADRIPSGMRLARFDGRQDRFGATKALNGIARDRLVLNRLGFPSVVLIQDAG